MAFVSFVFLYIFPILVMILAMMWLMKIHILTLWRWVDILTAWALIASTLLVALATGIWAGHWIVETMIGG